jgi:hypothetical protein
MVSFVEVEATSFTPPDRDLYILQIRNWLRICEPRVIGPGKAVPAGAHWLMSAMLCCRSPTVGPSQQRGANRCSHADYRGECWRHAIARPRAAERTALFSAKQLQGLRLPPIERQGNGVQYG